jgi:hypothetical protein
METELKYVGRAWRSRYLRAPKLALALASREDFVPLGSMATIRLGLKSGADKFFFLRRIESVIPDADERIFKRERGTLHVRGMNGWNGVISAKDTRAAILNPHEFLERGYRRFVVAKKTDALYLRPRDRKPEGDLDGYIRLAEREGIHKRQLVESNGSPSRWYRQCRGVVASRWALPYNSAYEYGLLDNEAGAILNGRFVGVEPMADVDPELLGAALASTFVLVTRLLEGVATGVEGAYDVGPPAARLIAVPDIRRIPAAKTRAIREAMETIRKLDRLPNAPDRDAHVEDLRNELDLALLRGLGASKGEAASIAGGAYQSYARWRKAVENVEMEMRGNRRAMTRAGVSRTVHPNELAARRVWEEIEFEVGVYPKDILHGVGAVEYVEVPRGMKMPTQDKLIDPGVVQLASGRSLDLRHYDRVRYVAMLAAIGCEGSMPVPASPTAARRVVDAFFEERVRVREESRKRAGAYTSDAASVTVIVEMVERSWIQKCRAAGSTTSSGQPETAEGGVL